MKPTVIALLDDEEFRRLPIDVTSGTFAFEMTQFGVVTQYPGCIVRSVEGTPWWVVLANVAFPSLTAAQTG